ncbi:hypothetical protein E1B28_012815 [Marasmius oreades]|uniref:Hydrophobin n=1 Tax=Marasmius oreades TaxID=181124 RepID=A0A9P7UQC0_9AGAR|nr:uncharacterized protein E1B28_012815 [Marasmius oreades]KAG7088861.1 hypothetical protein E1B28_012815 [Marasmius oreades]
MNIVIADHCRVPSALRDLQRLHHYIPDAGIKAIHLLALAPQELLEFLLALDITSTMQLKYLVGLCLVSATLALPVVDGDGGHYGGNHDGGSGGGGGKCKTGPVQVKPLHYTLLHDSLRTNLTVSSAATASNPLKVVGPVVCWVCSASSLIAISLLGFPATISVSSGGTLGNLDSSPINLVPQSSLLYSNAQTVCCEDNTFNGVIALGCTPINLNL